MTNEIGSFSNPHEELEYLRSKVLETEKKLERFGQEFSRHDVIKGSLKEFIEGSSPLLSETKHEETSKDAVIVQSLTENKQLHEMMIITETEGVIHALTVIEKMKGWKLEDDYHDSLIDLVSKGLPLLGVKEKGPEFKALHMSLYEVVLPKSLSNERPFSELIKGMEQLYAGFLSIASQNENETDYMVFEIANPDGTEDTMIFIAVPTDRKHLFETQMLAIFPNARLNKREKDYNVFSEGSSSMGSSLRLQESPAYPLKTADLFGEDPLNIILNSFSKIPKVGSGAAYQIIFKPRGNAYTERYQKSLERIKKGEKAKDVLRESTFSADFSKTLKDFVFHSEPKKKEEEKPVDTDAIESIQQKLTSPIVETNIRLIASGPTAIDARQLLEHLESGFNQFENAGKNRITFERTESSKESDFYRAFTFRLFRESEVVPLNLKELSTMLHFHTESLLSSTPLKQQNSISSPVPSGFTQSGTFIGINNYQGKETPVYMTPEDRLRHLYVIGQTGTGKSVFLKNLILEDIRRGDGVCFIDPHGSDVQDILGLIPPERMQDVIYFDPAYVERPMALNMLEFDRNHPEQKTFVVNEMLGIFNKLFDMKSSGGPMFEQYFRNAVLLTIDDPESGTTLVDVSRVLSSKEFRMLKLSKCTNPLVVQFWKEVAEKAGGESSLANMVPYIVSKFDNFLSNDIMRPVIAQEKSSFNLREVMDSKKILLVNLSKGRLGDLNANLIGLILVGKILMAALSRADSHGTDFPPFYLYIDEFQNISTDSISAILSEARKYKLSLNVAHQFISQLEENIKNAVFGNVGSMAVFRVGSEDAEFLEKQLSPVFTAKDIQSIDNLNAYIKMLSHGVPQVPFNIQIKYPERTEESVKHADLLKRMSYLKYGGDRAEIERIIMKKYEKTPPKPPLTPAGLV